MNDGTAASDMTASDMAAGVGSGAPQREIRVGLVLYGGVSLAIYEYGVARAFHDLVRENDGFAPLLDLLGAKARVDVMSGTSAGGINGILLAAALQSGADFANLSRLWRVDGDLERLMRKPSEEEPLSLLDGEDYYQRRLYFAMHAALEPRRGYAYDSEIDLFVTTTDYDGRELEARDGLGVGMSDATHRVVFQLKYRPGRTAIGDAPEAAAGEEAARERDESRPDRRDAEATAATERRRRALLLAAIARMTSSFPIAFPPFQSRQLDCLRAESEGEEMDPEHGRTGLTRLDVEVVQRALETMSRLGVAPGVGLLRSKQDDAPAAAVRRPFIDGGVLDNKPFGPAIRAIFYRMPSGPVDRHLFFVEPDPARFEEVVRANDAPPPAHEVGLRALVGIPRHEEFLSELDAVAAHSARIATFESIRQSARENLGRRRRHVRNSRAYRRARIESLAHALVSSEGASPDASDRPRGARGALCEAVIRRLDHDWRYSVVDAWDVEFQLRRAFHLLYAMYRTIEATEARSADDARWDAVGAVGRVIRLLEVLRAACVHRRDERLAAGETDPAALIAAVTGELGCDHDRMKPIVDELSGLQPSGGAVSTTASPPFTSPPRPLSSESLTSDTLSTFLRAARAAEPVVEPPPDPKVAVASAGDAGAAPRRSVLPHLSRAVDRVARAFDAASDGASSLLAEMRAFRRIDAETFPAEYVSGVHERDRIDVVRISPIDATCGVAPRSGAGGGMDKVAGETFGHFAAFLRRDFRSNDILWGRLDGIERLVKTLLDEGARKRTTGAAVAALAKSGRAASVIADCPKEVVTRWNLAVAACSASGASDPEGGAWDALREAWILAMQHRALAQDVPVVRADHLFQEVRWDAHELDGTSCRSETNQIERVADAAIRRDPAADPKASFLELGLGRVTRPDGTAWVPPHAVAELGSRAYVLLWTMFEKGLRTRDDRPTPVLSWTSVRVVLLWPVVALRVATEAMRRDRIVGPFLLFCTIVAFLAGAVVAVLSGAPLRWTLALVALFVLGSIAVRAILKARESGSEWRARFTGLFVLGVAGTIVAGMARAEFSHWRETLAGIAVAALFGVSLWNRKRCWARVLLVALAVGAVVAAWLWITNHLTVSFR